ncbi:catalase [Bdellovibrio sp. HCB274]|uniref:catalase n=1 Tax=Bdellovibrio sp. HCB274 TaxID=3394361 RepID=UPI0039B65E2E
MAKTKPSNKVKKSPSKDTNSNRDPVPRVGAMTLDGDFLTTNQGARISDNHNSLKAGIRGPTLLEDFVLREKITSFDHERIPERVVHARGAGAFGYFECTKNMSRFTEAGFLSQVGKRTPVLVRFSTVAGSRGSTDTARDVRGFATKFYTDEGNYDLVGNNIPVFFIQDAMKFPDLIHAAKPEQHNEIPQAQTAHDTFWDFISLMPESTHMVFWAMSDRAIPRSFRMMEGFGVHTFRFVNAKGEGTFVKFHWKPKLGIHGLVWEEALLISGQDPDFHRRDLFDAINSGGFPEWELGVQLVPESDEHKFPFDLLDPTKIIPEEMVPVTIIGRMVLNRNPDNFFSEIEQAVFHPGHLVPGIDVTNDPLLTGRLFSYTDTQITRLGGPNFHELPVNRPLASINNHQRDGFGRQTIPKGRVAYEPNSLGGGCPFHSPAKMKSFVHLTERVEGHKVRARSESFGDHFSQAKLFYNSQTKIEQDHIRDAFVFELSKVETVAVRKRMVTTLMMVDRNLAAAIAEKLGLEPPAQGVEQPNPANHENNIIPDNRSMETIEEDQNSSNVNGKKSPLPKQSPALSMVKTAPSSVETRKIALLVNINSPLNQVAPLRKSLEAEGCAVDVVYPGMEGPDLATVRRDGDKTLNSTPSVAYDGMIAMTDKYDDPEEQSRALRFIAQSFKHCKTIGAVGTASALVEKATMGLIGKNKTGYVSAAKSTELSPRFIKELSKHRHWERAELVKQLPA